MQKPDQNSIQEATKRVKRRFPIEKLRGIPKYGVVDRGYRGRKQVGGVLIIIPKKIPTSSTRYQIQKIRKLFRVFIRKSLPCAWGVHGWREIQVVRP